MFHSCRSITDLDLSNLNTENVEYFSKMFMSCYNLKRINLSSFDLSGIKTTLCTQDMFADCESIEVLDLRSFNINRF